VGSAYTLSKMVSGGGSGTANTAWAVLGDQKTNMQYTNLGYEYWTSLNSGGTGTMSNVVPGTYRLTGYVLGQWGELRYDGVSVTAGGTTTPSLTFTPENFAASGGSTVWTIGTPTRSSNKFLHGTNNYGGPEACSGCDDREYWGNWNYWNDFAANKGSVVYYATAVGSTPATNNLLAWNYTQWNYFNPGLYDSSNDTTDNYQHVIPSYVAGLSGATGTNGVTTPTPPWNVYFTTTSAQDSSGSYVDISIGLPCAESNLTASLNGHPLTWTAINPSDCMVRSGLSGYYQWVVFEWPTSDLAASLENAYVAPGVKGLRTGQKQISSATASIYQLRAFSQQSLTFVVTITQHLVSNKGTSNASNQFAVTLTGSGSNWQVYDVEPAADGNT